jgi:hypothetical protein
MKEIKEIVQKKSYKLYLLVIAILILTACFVWFIAPHSIDKNIYKTNDEIDQFSKPQEEDRSDEIVHINNVPPQQGENDLEDVKSLRANDSKLANRENLYVDLLQIIFSLNSKHDCSELINRLDNDICGRNCPHNVQASIKFLKEFNNSNINENLHLIFPKGDNSLEKLFSSLIKIEKIDPIQIKNQDYVLQHVELITNYISQFQISDKND